MSVEYLKLIIISYVIAIPLSYGIINWWLQNFAYKTNLGATNFIVGGVTALFIAILSVGYQSLKAASRNPVDSLRYE